MPKLSGMKELTVNSKSPLVSPGAQSSDSFTALYIFKARGVHFSSDTANLHKFSRSEEALKCSNSLVPCYPHVTLAACRTA